MGGTICNSCDRTSVEHELKTWPEFWDAVDRGEKTFEVRRNDRGFQKGDTLLLTRWDPKTMSYTEHGHLRLKVTYVLTGFGLKNGYVCLGLKRIRSV